MDIRKVKKLIELLEESGISEIEISEGEESVRISRYPNPGTVSVQALQHPALAPPPVAPAPAPAVPAEAAAAAPPAARGQQVTAPMVGTFYSGPAPGAKPFVEIGQEVVPEATVCIIEVMKLMNSLPAGTAGRVTHVLVDDAQPVEMGQPLIVIDPEA